MSQIRVRWQDKGTQVERESVLEGKSAGYDFDRSPEGYFVVMWADKQTLIVPAHTIIEIAMQQEN